VPRQTELVGCGSAAGTDDFIAARLGLLNNFFDRRSSRPEAAFDRTQMRPRLARGNFRRSTRPKGRIDGSALSKVQKHLGSDGRGFTIDI